MGDTERYLSKRRLWGKHLLIFVCTGSRDYQFNRLIEELDRLVATGELREEIFAQIGNSSPPKHFPYERFVDHEQFSQLQDRASLIISHAGTGALIGALRKGKQVIAVPRLARYGEHIDDHQTQIASVLQEAGYLRVVLNMAELTQIIDATRTSPPVEAWNKESRIVQLLEEFLSF